VGQERFAYFWLGRHSGCSKVSRCKSGTHTRDARSNGYVHQEDRNLRFHDRCALERQPGPAGASSLATKSFLSTHNPRWFQPLFHPPPNAPTNPTLACNSRVCTACKLRCACNAAVCAVTTSR